MAKGKKQVEVNVIIPKEQLSPEEEEELKAKVAGALVLFVPELEKMGNITVNIPRTKAPV